MLEAHDLTKSYGDVRALDGFNLTVQAGEIVGLVGHNGAGKTTFVEIVSGLIRADSGRVVIDGVVPRRARGRVGICPQHISLYPPITIREHLRLFGQLAGMRRASLRQEVDQLVAALRLTDFLDRQAGLLSGGQQRRAQAAVALIHRPGLLLLDEPTAGADPETRQALLDVVKQRASEGTAIVYTTHYLPELTDLDATIAVAQHGRVIARGTRTALLNGLPGEVRVTFDDPDPTSKEVSVSTTDHAATLIRLLSDAERPVVTVDVYKPSLDDLYRSLAVADAH